MEHLQNFLSINLDDMAGHKILYQILFVLDVIFLW